MIKLSGKARERLLYLISPIGLVVVWQLLLMAGIGDRRFIPAPSDIAQRFVKLIGNGELEWHVAVTLYRVFLGYIIGAVPAVAIGLLMAMFRPVRIFFDPLIAAGPNGSKPHTNPSDRIIEERTLVVADWGANRCRAP